MHVIAVARTHNVAQDVHTTFCAPRHDRTGAGSSASSAPSMSGSCSGTALCASILVNLVLR